MSHLLSRVRGRREDGAVAIIVALALTAILIVVALVLDFGLVRIDRQVDKSAADAAALAGLHGLRNGDTKPHPYAGVCNAVKYLKGNDGRFANLDPTSGWSDGAGTATGNGCNSTTPGLWDTVCNPDNKSTWAVYQATTTSGGATFDVRIESGYVINGTWSEDSLSSSQGDVGASAQKGCDQLAVTIAQRRKPGLGSLATSSDLRTAIRSVGRIKIVSGSTAPAMLLLRQTGCSILAAANTNTKLYVEGSASVTTGLSQPGTIHSDSNAGGCANNTWVYAGKQNDNIVAFAAPLLTDPSMPDPSKPGQITLYGKAGDAAGHFLDSNNNVCGSTSLYTNPPPSGQCPGSPVTQADPVTREPIDQRYLSAVQQIRDGANTAFSDAPGYTKVITACGNNPQSAIDLLNLTIADRVYVNCPGGFGPNNPTTILAGTVVFAGPVVNPSQLSMPNATKVYVAGDSAVAANKTGISLGNNTSFSMHTLGNMSGGVCSNSPTGPETTALSTNKAVLVVRNGPISLSNGGTFRACYTTVVMLSGKPDNACMPASPTRDAPSGTPCTPSAYTPGTGQLYQTGGTVDWTAPNQHVAMINADGSPNAFESAWKDPNGPEDLAFWSESANGNPSFNLRGGGTEHMVGVFMIPNADSLTLEGQFTQELVNAQFITSSITLAGGASISMRVDANSAVGLPRLDLIGLVR